MVIEYHKPGFLEAEIDKCTRLGSEQLQKGDLEAAQESFEYAYRRAKQLDDGFRERACAFNLGAVYIARKNAEKGLEILQRAVPPLNQRDGKSNGDLFHNFGHGYSILKKDGEAVKYYELALEEYLSEKDNPGMEAAVAQQIGEIRWGLRQHLQAARAYNVAATAYGKLQDYSARAKSLSLEANMLVMGHKVEEAIAAADDCVILCQHVGDPELVAKLYNELGLLYTQCREFFKSATCFELALPLIRSPYAGEQRDRRREEAVLLQNLGAVYNSLGDYERAVPYHQQAAALHVELGSRNSQGQCFLNLAFAHSQLGDNDTAGEYYLHALQAAKDTVDKKGQWQALEGLGAVSFHHQQYLRAVTYFKMALAVLAECPESGGLAQERIVGKLSDALQFQLGPVVEEVAKEPSVAGSQASGSRKGRKRRERQNQQERDLDPHLPIHEALIRPQEAGLLQQAPPPSSRPVPAHPPRQHRQNVKNSFLDHIATGLGTYDATSDVSNMSERELRRLRRMYSRSKSKQSDSADTVDQPVRKSQAPLQAAPPPIAPPPVPLLHQFEAGSAPEAIRRRHSRPLLRTDTNDTEEEWRRIAGVKRRDTGHLKDIFDSVVECSGDMIPKRIAQQVFKYLNIDAIPGQSALPQRLNTSPPGTADATAEGYRRRHQRKPRDPSDKDLLNILKRLTRKVERGEALSEGEIEEEEEEEEPIVRPKSAKQDSAQPQPESSSSADQPNEDYEDSRSLHQAYAQQLEGDTDTAGETSEEEEEEDLTDSEEEEEEQEEPPHTGQATPPLPTSSPPNTLQVATYEKPVSSDPQDANAKPPANYFRSEGDTKNEEDTPQKATFKVSVEVHGENEEDPIYHTIRTIRPEGAEGAEKGAGQGAGTSSQDAPSTSKQPKREWEEESGPPTLPPPRVQNMSRAEDTPGPDISSENETETDSETDSGTDNGSLTVTDESETEDREEFLSKVRQEHQKNREEREQIDHVPLPQQKRKTTSRMCVVM